MEQSGQLTLEQAFEQAVGHHQAGRIDDAGRLYRAILRASPDQPPVMVNLASLLLLVGRIDEAVEMYARVVQLQPGHANALAGLGAAQLAAGRIDAARQALHDALRHDPTHAEAAGNLIIVAGTLLVQEQLAQAEAALRAALVALPDHANALFQLAAIVNERDEHEEAEALLRRALRAAPLRADVHASLGLVLNRLERREEAEGVLREALRLDPDQVEAHAVLGAVLNNLKRRDEAEAVLRRALEIDPGHVEALAGLGAVLLNLERADEAESALLRTLALRPDHADARWNLALIRMLNGEFGEGLALFEARFPAMHKHYFRRFKVPRWQGEPLRGRRLLVAVEQGLGDQIQFLRYVPLLAAHVGAPVIVEVNRELRGLFDDIPGAAEVVTFGEPLPRHDLVVPQMSLPHLLGTRLSDVPPPLPGVAAPADLRQAWGERLASLSGLRVGMVWAGNPGHANDHNRSIELRRFAPLAALPGVSLVSIQKGAGEKQLADCAFPLTVLGPEIKDFADTAAIVSHLDVVVCVDTSVAHLCGALGVPTWVLLPAQPDWRWLLGREDSPWYPSLRLFRQRRSGDWDEVLQRVAAELARLRDAR